MYFFLHFGFAQKMCPEVINSDQFIVQVYYYASDYMYNVYIC